MFVDFGKTIYVSDCGAENLDSLNSSFNPQMTGDGLVCIDYEDFANKAGFITEKDCEDNPFNAFLSKTYNQINESLPEDEPRGDIVFSK